MSGETYYVVGDDGQKYGPSGVEVLKQWQAERRIVADTILERASDGEQVRADSVLTFAAEDVAAPPVQNRVEGTTPPPNYAYLKPESAPKKSIWPYVAIGMVLFCGFGMVILAAILLPVFSSAKVAAKKTAAMSNMKQLSLGVVMYAADWDEVFPTGFNTESGWHDEIMPYVKDETLFRSTNPAGGKILANKTLAGGSMVELIAPEDTILLYDSMPWDNKRGLVAYTDGHVKMLPNFGDIATNLAVYPFEKPKATGKPKAK